jgi:DNA-binding transcriptional MerR regulator
MKAEIKKKLKFLIELGLSQNEINEILDAQEILNQSQEFKKEEIFEDE